MHTTLLDVNTALKITPQCKLHILGTALKIRPQQCTLHILGHLAPVVTGKYTAIHTFAKHHVIIIIIFLVKIISIIDVIIIMMEGKQGNSWLHVITLGIIHQ